jgi:hypothetical protein
MRENWWRENITVIDAKKKYSINICKSNINNLVEKVFSKKLVVQFSSFVIFDLFCFLSI